jgi:hypothetical protein
MEQRTFVGTWEEIAPLRAELAGCKVRLTILDEAPARGTLKHALAQLIADAERLATTLPPITRSAPSDAWSDGVLEKYRRQGFTL